MWLPQDPKFASLFGYAGNAHFGINGACSERTTNKLAQDFGV